MNKQNYTLLNLIIRPIQYLCLGLIALFSIPTLSQPTFAADTLRLSLEKCIELALTEGPSASQARFDSIIVMQRYRSSFGELFPQLRFSAAAPNWWESLDERVVYDPDLGRQIFQQVPSREIRYQGQLYLTQSLPWGAELDMSSRLYKRNWYWESTNGALEINEYSLANRINLAQPLLAGNPVGRQRRISAISRKTGLIDYELKMRDSKYKIVSAFYGLVSAIEERSISNQDYESGIATAELATRKIKAGLIPEVELLQIQVDVARREATQRNAEGAVKAAEDQLKIELNLPLDDRIIEPLYSIADTIIIQPVSLPAPEERLEVLRSRLNRERNEIETRASVWSERVQASLALYYETDARRRSLDSLDLPVSRNKGVYLRLELPIFGFGSTSGKVEALKVGLRSAKVQEMESRARVIAEQREALRRLQRASDHYRIASAALQLSERSFEITNSRFESGLVSSRDLIDAQLDLTRTRKDLLAARIECELALANLERMTAASASLFDN